MLRIPPRPRMGIRWIDANLSMTQCLAGTSDVARPPAELASLITAVRLKVVQNQLVRIVA